MKPFVRIDNPIKLDTELIESELSLGKEVIIQFADVTYTNEILGEINALCSKCDENLCIRFYGHYSKTFDCKILRRIPNVKCLYTDCLTSVKNLHILTELENLKILSIGVFEITDPEILGSNNFRNLTELIIAETKTQALNLGHLEQIKKLRSLRIGGHTKNIEAIGNLAELESLSLNSVKKVPVTFINKLKALKSLEFLLGGRCDLNEIEENEIERLDIIWVRGFNDLSCISNFPKLRELRDVNFDAFMKQELPSNVKNLGFYTGKSKLDNDIKAMLLEKGYFCM
ncbi:MAG: hypothetical protein ACRYFZ_19390 [Janthinobacterium lividum]